MANPTKSRTARNRIKRGPGKRMVDGKCFRLADEVRYIQRRAAEHDSRIVSIGQVVLFSSESGDAWMLDPSEQLAVRLASDGHPELIHIEDTETTFTVAWTGQYRIRDHRSSTPIGIAGGPPLCSVTRRGSSLRSGQPARAGAAMRSNF